MIDFDGGGFAADTLVWMGDGTSRKIDEILVGDEVLASPDGRRELLPRRVEEVMVRQVEDTLRVHFLDGTELNTTGVHRFCIPPLGFVPASHLSDGTGVRAYQSAGHAVVSQLVPQAGEAIVYHLAVAEDHTYCVGDRAVLAYYEPL